MRACLISATFVLFFSFVLPSTLADELHSESEKLVDLTHPFDDQTIYWPTEPGFKLERESAGMTDKG